MRLVISLCLAFVLAFTSQVMAGTRAADPATGQMVLCIGDQAVTVYTNAEGQPTAAPHICPDCIPAADLPRAAAFLPHLENAPTAVEAPAQARIGTRPAILHIPPSRGPPHLL